MFADRLVDKPEARGRLCYGIIKGEVELEDGMFHGLDVSD